MARPWVLITGATGFLGGQLVRYLRKEYRIYAFGRRSPEAAGAPQGPGIEWFRVDLADRQRLEPIFAEIRDRGGADLLLHLAAYYDFSGDDHPEYRRTNVEGTRNVVELATTLGLRRLIYTSSVAACPFPARGEVVDETTAPTAPVPYARSKRAGEALMRQVAGEMPTCIVRPAAVFSPFCEYEPLDTFLQTWCSHKWNARVLGGRGESAIPYLHVEDLVSFYVRVVEKCDELQPAEVLIASPDGSTSHRELFDETTRCYFGAPRRAIPMPAALAGPGIRARELLGRITGRMPFERAWMVDYIDLKLTVDASRTRRRIDWAPSGERSILRGLEEMVHNLREHPVEWQRRSQARKDRVKPSLPIR